MNSKRFHLFENVDKMSVRKENKGYPLQTSLEI